jgi:hypothetical protein
MARSFHLLAGHSAAHFSHDLKLAAGLGFSTLRLNPALDSRAT